MLCALRHLHLLWMLKTVLCALSVLSLLMRSVLMMWPHACRCWLVVVLVVVLVLVLVLQRWLP